VSVIVVDMGRISMYEPIAMQTFGGRRLGRAALLVALTAAGLLTFGASSVRAGDAEGTVVFRVELRGVVPPDVSFLVGRDTRPPSIIEPGIYVCGPAENPYVEPGGECRTGETYATALRQRPNGETLAYSFSYESPHSPSTVLHEGTVTVTEGAQTVTLVHDFSGTSLLPDTSTANNRAPTELVAMGWVLIGGAAAVGVRRLWRKRRARCG
jgi:hypothetical protein